MRWPWKRRKPATVAKYDATHLFANYVSAISDRSYEFRPADSKPSQPTIGLATAMLRRHCYPRIKPTDLAREAGVSHQYVSAVLAGHKPPSRKLIAAAVRLGIPIPPSIYPPHRHTPPDTKPKPA